MEELPANKRAKKSGPPAAAGGVGAAGPTLELMDMDLMLQPADAHSLSMVARKVGLLLVVCAQPLSEFCRTDNACQYGERDVDEILAVYHQLPKRHRYYSCFPPSVAFLSAGIKTSWIPLAGLVGGSGTFQETAVWQPF